MVFCSCKKSTPPSSTTTTPQPKRRFTLFRKNEPLAYITTDLDAELDATSNTPAYTSSQLSQIKSTKKSKQHVDSVLYRNRHAGRKTLLTKDGVVSFSGFVDYFQRKKLRESADKGQRYDANAYSATNNGGGVAAPVMISRVKRIDPVKSGFMGKKSDRDEMTGCAAGTMVVAHGYKKKESQRPSTEGMVVTTPMKSSGCAPMGCGADESFATVSTAGFSPLSSGSRDGLNEKRVEGEEEEVWCDVFHASTSSPNKEVGEDSSALSPTTTAAAATTTTTTPEEESAWCDLFNSSTIVTEEEVEVTNNNQVERSVGIEVEDPNAKIRGIRNVEVVYEERKSLLKRVSTWKSSRRDGNKDSFGQVQ